MKGHARRAGRAFRHPAAQRAADHTAVAAPVEKQNRLFALLQRVDQLALKLLPNHAAASFTRLPAQICNLHLGQARTHKPLSKRKHRIFALFCSVIGLNRWSCGAENKQRALVRGAVLGHIARVIARRLLGFICAVLLLVEDEHPEMLDRRENCRARADDDARAAGFDLFKAVIPFSGRQRGVQHSDCVTELCGKLPHHLRCQADLRHQHDCTFALLKRMRNQFEIYLRFSAAGHAE